MEETYTQAIDIRQYKRSGTHLNLLVVSKKEGLSEIPLGEFHKDRILMVGDRENDVKGAHQNHVEVLGVLYGYGSRRELETAGCIHFAKTVAETKSFILQ